MSLLETDQFRFVPCVHRRIQFAVQVRRAVLEWRPDAIALELPAALEEWIVRGAMRLPRLSAVTWEEPERAGELAYVPIDPADALIEAVRLGCENEIPLEFIDLDCAGVQEPHLALPDDLVVERLGLEAFVAAAAPYISTAEDDAVALARERHMAARLRELAEGGRRVLCVLGLAHFSRVRRWVIEPEPDLSPAEIAPARRMRTALADIDAGSVGSFMAEIPHLAWLYEQTRQEFEIGGEIGFDALDGLRRIYEMSGELYRERYKETINLTQWKALLQYARNLAMTHGRLRPELYELVEAARGVVDGDDGYEVYDMARAYPPQEETRQDLPRLQIRHGRGIIEGRDEKFRLRPRVEEPPSETVKIGFRRRRASRDQMRVWKEEWDRSRHSRICSWPPEDEMQEKFMDFLRKRALQVLTEDRKQVQEFSTSLLDGLDVRETMRNWHTGKLYVQSSPQPQGRCGAVVLIFRDQPMNDSDSWRTTLYAENQNESDITFFATPLGEQVVGPRISRTEFGGILSVYPATGLPDIWSFQLGRDVHTCGEALAIAAVVFSPDKFIAYVAARPPREMLRHFAALNHKRLIYMPLHQFSPDHLKKIRRFHILDGRDVRAWAHDFIEDL